MINTKDKISMEPIPTPPDSSFETPNKQGKKILNIKIILDLYQEGYSPDAIALKTTFRKDKIIFIIGREIIDGRLKATQPSITIVKRLPKFILNQFPQFPQHGPYLLHLVDGKLQIDALK